MRISRTRIYWRISCGSVYSRRQTRAPSTITACDICGRILAFTSGWLLWICPWNRLPCGRFWAPTSRLGLRRCCCCWGCPSCCPGGLPGLWPRPGGSSDNFSADLYYGSSILDYNMIGNDIGPSSGRRFIDHARRSAIRNGMIEVEYDGSWTIQIRPVAASATTNVRGSGDAVTGIFTAKTSRAVVSYSAAGSDNIAANLYAVDGTDTFGKLVANGIAPCSGASVAILTPGEQYFMVVDAGDNTWSIDFGLGDSVTNYDFGPGSVESEDPDYGDPSGPDYDEPGSEKKWSYDDVTRLKGYVEDAQDYLTDAGNYAQAAIDNKLMSVAYMNNAKSAVEGAQRNYENALVLMSSRVELTYESGGTMAEKIQGTYDNLDSALDISIEGDPYDYALDFMKIVANAMSDNKTYIYNVGQLYESMLRTD